MRDTDPKPSQHGALGAPIRPKAEPPPPQTWVPVGKQHERDADGNVRLRPGVVGGTP